MEAGLGFMAEVLVTLLDLLSVHPLVAAMAAAVLAGIRALALFLVVGCVVPAACLVACVA